jgi:hypothetical protein
VSVLCAVEWSIRNLLGGMPVELKVSVASHLHTGAAPKLIVPSFKGNDTISLDRSASFKLDERLDRNGMLLLTVQFAGARGKRGTSIKFKTSAIASMELAVIDDSRVEFQVKNLSSKRCIVRCADGTVGSPCAICKKKGRSVRFCC